MKYDINTDIKKEIIKEDYVGASLEKRTTFIVKTIQEKTKDEAPDVKILDIGCGTGNIPFRLASLKYNVLATDIDQDTITYCRTRNLFPNLHFITANAQMLGIEEKFNIIVCTEVIEHLSNSESVIDEIYNHLEPNGFVIISIPNGYCLWEIVVSRGLYKTRIGLWIYRSKLVRFLSGTKTSFYSMNSGSFHEKFFTLHKFKSLVKENGFSITTINNTDLGILPEWKWLKFLKSIECRIANITPKLLAGGWIVVCTKLS
jgi:2-polyprenyl-3-methyl-5-hydroxy-6-metoxy-1,4-benzoquinol methylase